MKQVQNQFMGRSEDLSYLPEGSTFLDLDNQVMYMSVGGQMVALKNGDGSFVSNDTTDEPTGADPVETAVFLTQAEYDAGTPNESTLYIITDATSDDTLQDVTDNDATTTNQVTLGGGANITLADYADNATAVAAGLLVGDLYQNSGVVMVVTA